MCVCVGRCAVIKIRHNSVQTLDAAAAQTLVNQSEFNPTVNTVAFIFCERVRWLLVVRFSTGYATGSVDVVVRTVIKIISHQMHHATTHLHTCTGAFHAHTLA